MKLKDQQDRIAIEPKDRDVYRFTYSQESWDRAQKGLGHGDLNWCFDGQLVYRDGLLCDTYWGLDWRGDNGRHFTVQDAQASGRLEFVCNLSEVEKIPPEDFGLYVDGDAFNLSHQHGCYKHYVKRIGARKDKDRILAALDRKVQDAKDDIDRAAWKLEFAVKRREEVTRLVEAGEEPQWL